MGNMNNKIVDSIESINLLKQWSNKFKYKIIFDSDIDGDGSNNILCNIVINKSNLYFITFDTNNNVFGGYINKKISRFNGWIYDKNSFVFSFIRDGNVKNTKYSIKPCWNTFYLYKNNQNGILYSFGLGDLIVNPIGKISICRCHSYDYNNEQNPLADAYQLNISKSKRIIIVQMV